MSDQSKRIRVTRLLEATPSHAPAGESFSFWHVRFKLSPTPDRVWRQIFGELSSEAYDAKAIREKKLRAQDDDSDFGIGEEERDVVTARGPTNKIPVLLKEIRELVKQTNAKYSKGLTENQSIELQSAAIEKQIEEWKEILEFDNAEALNEKA